MTYRQTNGTINIRCDDSTLKEFCLLHFLKVELVMGVILLGDDAKLSKRMDAKGKQNKATYATSNTARNVHTPHN